MTEKPTRHINIPLFIPHLGCRHACVFCDQRTISGGAAYSRENTLAEMARGVRMLPPGQDAEIAFFGGSFTGIDRSEMIALLDAAAGYAEAGAVRGIRLSTRPDYIDEEVLSVLSRYPVKTVELGVQSMSDRVLRACRRGHDAAQTVRAFGLLREAGFRIGGQMMTGLPASGAEDERDTARAIVQMGAREARVYSTVVIGGTALDAMTRRGEYSPLTKEDAVRRAADAVRIFSDADVTVLRTGLCETESLHGPAGITAGYYSPAFGEEVESRLYLDVLLSKIEALALPCGSEVIVFCGGGKTSRVIGHQKVNKLIILEKYGVKIKKVIEKPEILGYNILMTTEIPVIIKRKPED